MTTCLSDLQAKLADAAIRYADLGYRVFPCVPGAKMPLTTHGLNDATDDIAQITAWWSATPLANIGLATAGLVVVDVDGAGNPWLADNADNADTLANAPSSLTPRGGRHFLFRQPDGKAWRNTTSKLADKVDTRADGGYIIAPPSVVDGKPYRWADGYELDFLLSSLDTPPAWLVELLDQSAVASVIDSAGDANPIPAGLRNATLAKLGGGMRRIGMSEQEILASLLTCNANRCQPPIPDREVKQIAASVARYEPDAVSVALVENHYEQMFGRDDTGELRTPPAEDPGPLPVELLRMPGFVGEVMGHCLATAPYPNPAMAFCGALALQSFLAGRKVSDCGGNRTNIYILGLAHSAAGKDWPRKVNNHLIHSVGLSDGLGERFASGEGIQDALFLSPSMLFQTDEIDGMLQMINKSKDARHEAIMQTMLTMYGLGNSIYAMRRKAGKESPGIVDQPNLTIFGTAIPNHYYEALSERMLTNGLFARMLIFEAGQRANGQEPRPIDAPSSIMDVAKWWANFRPGGGNLNEWHPRPIIVGHTEAGDKARAEARETADVEWHRAEANSDAVGTTVWGRVGEHVRKLALIYAVSENHLKPQIDIEGVRWATAIVMHQTRRMLFMAASHVSENAFHADCLKVVQLLREAPNRTLSHSCLLKRMRSDAKTFSTLMDTLCQQSEVEAVAASTLGRASRAYRLLR